MKLNKKSNHHRSFSTFLTSALAAAVFIVGAAPGAHAQVTFNTNSATGWAVTGGGAVNATPYVVNISSALTSGTANYLSLTSTGDGTGTFVSGGSVAGFDGYWTAVFTFTLPADFTSATLNFNHLLEDDRGVFELNGTPIAYSSNSVGSNPGSIVLTDGGSLLSHTYPTSLLGAEGSGTVTTGFVAGVNTLEMIINNTFSGVNGADLDISAGDNAIFSVAGSVTYTEVPEPSTYWLAGLGAMGIIVFRMRQKRTV